MCTPSFYRWSDVCGRAVSVVRSSGGHCGAAATSAAVRLAGPDLRDLVDVGVDHHADHRITAGHRMIGPEDHRQTVGRHLDCAAGGALAGQLPVRPAVLAAASRSAAYRPGRCGW